MIRSDFHDAASIFRDLSFYQTLMLNGFYVRTHADAARLADAGINRTMVSVDSDDPAVHDEIRGRTGAFDRASTVSTFIARWRTCCCWVTGRPAARRSPKR